jgi:hypothetical protein
MSDFLIEPISSLVQQTLQQGATQLHGNPVETVIADANPGYPCRLSLLDAQEGEELYLFSHSPFSAANAYRETGPVFIRKNAIPADLKINELPEVALARSVVVRAYDGAGSMLAARPVESGEVATTIREFFSDKAVENVHLRAIASGCFLCSARRA